MADLAINAVMNQVFSPEELAQVDRDISEARASGLPLCWLCEGGGAVTARKVEGEERRLCEACDEGIALADSTGV